MAIQEFHRFTYERNGRENHPRGWMIRGEASDPYAEHNVPTYARACMAHVRPRTRCVRARYMHGTNTVHMTKHEPTSYTALHHGKQI